MKLEFSRQKNTQISNFTPSNPIFLPIHFPTPQLLFVFGGEEVGGLLVIILTYLLTYLLTYSMEQSPS
jgi:hypothetical protein